MPSSSLGIVAPFRHHPSTTRRSSPSSRDRFEKAPQDGGRRRKEEEKKGWCCHALPQGLRQLRRTGGHRPRKSGSQRLQPVQDHVLLQCQVPKASLETGRAQATLHDARTAQCIGSSGGGRRILPEARSSSRGGGGRCAICLESLGSSVQILECGHRFHKACVDELIKRDVQQACPLCRVQLPYNPKKREG